MVSKNKTQLCEQNDNYKCTMNLRRKSIFHATSSTSPLDLVKMVSCERVESFHSLCTKQWHESHTFKTNNQRHTSTSHGHAFRLKNHGRQNGINMQFPQKPAKSSFVNEKTFIHLYKTRVSNTERYGIKLSAGLLNSIRRHVLTTLNPSHYIDFAVLKNAKNTWKVVNEIISIKDKF